MLHRLAQLQGTYASGTLQIAESALNEILLTAGTGHRHPALEVQPGNSLLVRYGVLHAHATLPAGIQPGESPQLTLHLRSLLVAMALRAGVHQPYIHVHGRQLTIDLAAIPALQPWRDLWKYLEHAEFETAPGALRIRFSVRVTVKAQHDA